MASKPMAPGAAAVSPRARRVTLALLTATYFFSYMDRQILAILQEDIKADLMLSDTQLGLLAGFAFALFYATLGIPVASLADRTNRRNIIAIALAIWSGATAVCGLAANYPQLLAARIGVGIGEAGSSPPSHSMIADMYPPNERASALAIYSLGVYFGGAGGLILGGNAVEEFGWRAAFFIVGIPGVILALFVRLFATEPPRGLSDAKPGVIPATVNEEAAEARPSVMDGFRAMWKSKAAVHLVLAVTLTSLIGYALTGWTPSFLIRSFGMTPASVGNYYAPLSLVAGAGGVMFSGKLADWLAKRKGIYAQAWMVAWLKLAAFPALVLFYFMYDVYTAVAVYLVAHFLQSCYLGPTFALIQGLAPVKMRSVWAAISLLVINLIGLGAGPTLIGVLSDYYASNFDVGEESLRWALLTTVMLTPWAIFHYWRAGSLLKTNLDEERAAAEAAAAELGVA